MTNSAMTTSGRSGRDASRSLTHSTRRRRKIQRRVGVGIATLTGCARRLVTTGVIAPMALLRQRRRRPEVMDQPGLDPRRHAHALAGLARINRLSATERTYWRPLRELQNRHALP